MRIVAFSGKSPPAVWKSSLEWLDAEKSAKASRFGPLLLRSSNLLSPLPGEDRATVHVEHFSGNEAGVWSAQEQHRSGDFFRRAHTAQRNRAADAVATLCSGERSRTHVGVDPSRRNAVHVNAGGGEFAGEALGHADERALRGRVVAVKGLAALPAGRADEHDVSGRR